MNNYKIYALKLKDNPEIKYIGYTGKTIEERLYNHLHCTIKFKYKNATWIKFYKDQIETILIEDNIPTIEEAWEKEIYYIDFYKKMGFDLNNTTEGGKGIILTAEMKLKISNSLKGKISPRKGVKLTEETINKLKNREYTEETKKKISLAKKGKPSPRKGAFHTEEAKKKMSLSKTGKVSPRKGAFHSKETKKKMSIAKKGKLPPNIQKVNAYLYLTGEYVGTYISYVECAKQLGICGGHINQVISGKRNHTHGYTFKKC